MQIFKSKSDHGCTGRMVALRMEKNRFGEDMRMSRFADYQDLLRKKVKNSSRVSVGNDSATY